MFYMLHSFFFISCNLMRNMSAASRLSGGPMRNLYLLTSGVSIMPHTKKEYSGKTDRISGRQLAFISIAASDSALALARCSKT